MNATAGQAEVKVIPIAGQVQVQVNDDEFLAVSDLVPVKRDAAERSLRLVLSEIELMTRDKQWADILAAFHPVTDKLPEVTDHRLDVRVREKIAFALGHLGKFDEAIAELEVCVQREPDNFHMASTKGFD